MIENEAEEKTPFRRFDDELADLIDRAPASLTIAELVGCLELQVHVLKMRFYAGPTAREEK